VKKAEQFVSVFVSCCWISLFSSCVATNTYSDTPTAIRFAYPSLYLDGTYAKQLTVDDVRQIVALARSRSDILKPVDHIEVKHPDEAEVDGGSSRTGHLMTRFKVRKGNGRWIIIKGSVQTSEVIITS
jgi:hypothetical protein